MTTRYVYVATRVYVNFAHVDRDVIGIFSTPERAVDGVRFVIHGDRGRVTGVEIGHANTVFTVRTHDPRLYVAVNVVGIDNCHSVDGLFNLEDN